MGLDSSRCQHRDPAIDCHRAITFFSDFAKLGARSANPAYFFGFCRSGGAASSRAVTNDRYYCNRRAKRANTPKNTCNPLNSQANFFFGSVEKSFLQ
jgi:hypothetical protein